MSCISCHLTEATLEHRQDPSKRFCGNECYEEWRLRQGADATPIGEGIFMRMLRTPPASGFGETGQLNRDIFWKIMKSGNITAKDLVRDIGDVSNLPDTKEAYFAWRRRMRIIMKWIANATVDELPSKTLFLSEMLYTSIEEDFVYLRDFLWGRFPSLQNDYRDFPTRSIGTDMVKILVRHWPQKFWELVQQHDPLDLKYVMELTFIAASGNPMVIPLVQYFGKYYHVEELYKLLTGFKPNMRDVMAILDNPETYVSADENRLYKALEHESTRLTYRTNFYEISKEKCKELLGIVENHPKFKMPTQTFFKRVFKKKEQHLVARFTPLYLSNEIREIIIGILDHFMFEKTDDTDVQSVRILIDNITVRFPLDFGQIGSDAPGIVWIIELLISRNLVSSIEIFPEQVIDYVQTHGVENVPEFIQFVLFFNEPPIWFSDVPLIYIGKIMSMGPKSKTLMYGVLRRMSTKVLESMPSEFKKRIRKTYNYDQSIEKMLFKTDDDDDDVITEEEEEDEEAMEAEYKKIKK